MLEPLLSLQTPDVGMNCTNKNAAHCAVTVFARRRTMAVKRNSLTMRPSLQSKFAKSTMWIVTPDPS